MIAQFGPALAAALVCVAASAAAQDAPTLRTEATPEEITVGGRVVLTISVDHGSGAQVHFPDSLDLAPFEVLDRAVVQPVAVGEGRLRSVARYSVTAFELGELEIPSFEVAVTDAAGGATALETSPWGVRVVSVGRDETGDIRGVKAPLEIPISGLLVAALALLLLLVAVLAVWLYRRHRSQPAAGPIDVAVPFRPPYEVAYDALRELEASGLLERGELKAYYIRVSEIIRTYVEDHLGVPALEMASFEVVDGLAAIGLDRATVQSFEGFLAECDLVKFARFRPEPGRAREIVPRAVRLVDRTKVGRPAPAPAAVVAPLGAPVSAGPEEVEVDAFDAAPDDPGGGP